MEVSLVFLGDRAMREINKTWRKRDKNANVLSFPLDESVGEVAVNPFEAEREARRYSISYKERIVFLFVHGLLHLYGYDHETPEDARKMEKKEQELMRFYKKT